MKTLRERFLKLFGGKNLLGEPIINHEVWGDRLLDFIEEEITLATREVKREMKEEVEALKMYCNCNFNLTSVDINGQKQYHRDYCSIHLHELPNTPYNSAVLKVLALPSLSTLDTSEDELQ